MKLILASASPRRADLLTAAGIAFDVVAAEIDESMVAGETPEQYVRRLAAAKARAVGDRAGQRPVLAADTVVVVDGTILGKPADERDAKKMLRLLSGRSHQVMTGVYFTHGPGRVESREPIVEVSTVVFATLTDAEIDWYVASGEPFDKAGAYAIQGLASRFVTRVEGSYSNVVGLPVARVYELCVRAGLLIS